MTIDVELVGVTKSYGSMVAVDNLSLQLKRGEFLTLLGPSGCGKTTTLNMIAGFIDPTAGEIRLQGKRVDHLPPYNRDTAVVFQQYALFPHMTVFDNIAFGLRMRRRSNSEIKVEVDAALAQVRLTGFADRVPRQLSGGQQQRVALARAFVVKPAVLLLDEPLSNLDLKLREAMRLEIKLLHQQLGITSIYVTHDQEEALTMSDRIAVMNRGRVEQLGIPEEIYERPATRFVAEFIGTTNLLTGHVTWAAGRRAKVAAGAGTSWLVSTAAPVSVGSALSFSLRPEQVRLTANQQDDLNRYKGHVEQRVYQGGSIRFIIRLQDGIMLTAVDQHLPGKAAPQVGDEVSVAIDPAHCLMVNDTAESQSLPEKGGMSRSEAV